MMTTGGTTYGHAQGVLAIDKEPGADPLAAKPEEPTAETPQQPAKLEDPEPTAKPRERRSNAELLNLIVECGENARDYAKQIVEVELARDIFDADWKMARIFAMSGEFSDLKKQDTQAAVATAMAKIQLGRSWGIDAASAMRFIFFTNGKPGIEGSPVRETNAIHRAPRMDR